MTSQPPASSAAEVARPSVSWLARASGQNILGSALPLLAALAAMPLVARLLTPGDFGIVALAWAIAGYFSLFDLGLGRAVTKLGADAWARSDVDRLRSIVSSALRIQLSFALVVAALVFLAAQPLARALGAAADQLPATRDSIRLLAIAIPAVMITNTYRGALEAARRFDLVNVLRAPLGASVYLLAAVGALAGAGPRGIIALLTLSRILGVIAFAAAYRSAMRKAATTAGSSRVSSRELLVFGGWVTVTSALVPLTTYLDRFLVGAFASLGAVAFYSAPYELTMRLLIIPGSIAAVLLPLVSHATQTNDAAALKEQLNHSFAWSAAAMFAVSAVLMSFAGPVLGAWLGAAYENASTLTFQLLLVATYLNGLALLPFTVLEGVGRPDLVAKYHLAELPVYVLAAIWLIQRYGMEGAAYAWIGRSLVALLTLLWLMGRAKEPVARHARPATMPLGLLGAMLLTGSIAADGAGAPPWAIATVNLTVLGATLVWWTVRNPRAALHGALLPASGLNGND